MILPHIRFLLCISDHTVDAKQNYCVYFFLLYFLMLLVIDVGSKWSIVIVTFYKVMYSLERKIAVCRITVV